jgi:hypothetical protein
MSKKQSEKQLDEILNKRLKNNEIKLIDLIKI